MPKILPFNFGEEDYTSGTSAQLQCIVTEGDLPVDIRWTTLGTTHSGLMGISVTKIGSKSSILQIDSVDASHSGDYTCMAQNAAGKASYSAKLTVVGVEKSVLFFCSHQPFLIPLKKKSSDRPICNDLVAPMIAPFSFGDDEALNSGDFVVVQCSAVKGDSPLSLRWAFQSRPLLSGSDSKAPTGLSVTGLGERISVLSIQSVAAVHNGEYTCTAENPAGVTNYTASLTVNGILSEGFILILKSLSIFRTHFIPSPQS